jgi:hypothetical protein
MVEENFMTKEQVHKAVVESFSKSEACRKLGLLVNGSGLRQLQKLINDFSLDTSHFNRGGVKKRKWDRVIKICPVCGTEFETRVGHSREKTVCSHSCSNTFFKSGSNHPNFKDIGSNYRDICFKFYPKKCLFCSWDDTLDVHHIDKDRENNDITNLIPVCPNHHSLFHRGTKDQIEELLKKIEVIKL